MPSLPGNRLNSSEHAAKAAPVPSSQAPSQSGARTTTPIATSASRSIARNALGEPVVPNPKAITRLAPSPTGAQHVGNARTYLISWLFARAFGGGVLLRIEDIDSPRVKPHAAQEAMDDLRWLGL